MTGAIEYAQARIQARHGARPAERAWISLHAAVTLGALLDGARAGPLAAWISGVDPGSSADEIELALRERLRERIVEVARWMPPEWRAAVLWTRVLLDLPALQYLAAGRAPLPWMARDPGVAPHLAAAADDERPARLRREWRERWQRLWPRAQRDDAAALGEVTQAIEAHVERFARAGLDEAWSLRRALQSRLEMLFRRHALTPAAAFAHLALVALDVERLRAELATRAARLPGPGP